MVADPCLGHLACRNATSQAMNLISQQKMVSRPQPSGIRSNKAVTKIFFFFIIIFRQSLGTFLTALISIQALSISCSCFLTDGSGTDLPFWVCQSPINSISDLSNSKQVLLCSLSLNSSEREQNVSLQCHMQLFYLVHFLNVCYIQVNLGLVTSTILTSPKFNINSPYLHHEGT